MLCDYIFISLLKYYTVSCLLTHFHTLRPEYGARYIPAPVSAWSFLDKVISLWLLCTLPRRAASSTREAKALLGLSSSWSLLCFTIDPNPPSPSETLIFETSFLCHCWNIIGVVIKKKNLYWDLFDINNRKWADVLRIHLKIAWSEEFECICNLKG